MTPRKNVLSDVWAKVDRSGGPDACWPWTGARTQWGYGLWSVNGHQLGAHRAAWMAEHGDIPDGLLVCHRCDNRPCCNPSHLFLGTHQDNNEDMVAKGRGKADTHGAEHGTYSGYMRHTQRAGGWTMPACQPCLDAATEYHRQRRANLPDTLSRAHRAILTTLSDGQSHLTWKRGNTDGRINRKAANLLVERGLCVITDDNCHVRITDAGREALAGAVEVSTSATPASAHSDAATIAQSSDDDERPLWPERTSP